MLITYLSFEVYPSFCRVTTAWDNAISLVFFVNVLFLTLKFFTVLWFIPIEIGFEFSEKLLFVISTSWIQATLSPVVPSSP